MAIIEAHGLARTFVSRRRKVEAVRGVDLQVDDGEIVGFLGPNGAGKTTTLRMLTTLLSPTAGTATVCGADLRRDPLSVRRRIGYVPQAIGITAGGSDPNCLVREELKIQAQVYRVPAAEIPARMRRMTEQLELAGLEDRLCKTLSGGQRRRLDIALGLIHCPAWFSWMSPPRALTRRAGATCGTTFARCARTCAPRCSSPPTTSRKQTRSATASSSSTMARSSPPARRRN
jgi:ABC-2 type transport system ATP-binding protein